jgi:hypothetical protein
VRNGTVATATNIQSVRPVLKKIENRFVLVENVFVKKFDSAMGEFLTVSTYPKVNSISWVTRYNH